MYGREPEGNGDCEGNGDYCDLRADNWRVDTQSEPSQHNGLSPFGKVSH